MSKQYRKIALTLVISSDAADQVRTELEQAADLIAIDNFVYEYRVDDKRCRKPANASEYDLDDEEEPLPDEDEVRDEKTNDSPVHQFTTLRQS